ncbi:MAG: hypothetical protein U0556_19460 [Dehalococcoidia bacterium]
MIEFGTITESWSSYPALLVGPLGPVRAIHRLHLYPPRMLPAMVTGGAELAD